MKNVFIVSAAFALVAAGCAKEDVCQEDFQSKTVSVDISVPVSLMTKVTDLSDEARINTLQVFLFRENGVLEACKSVAAANVSFDCSVGTKDIAAVVNAPEINGVKTYQELKETVSGLKDNSAGAFVMYGAKRMEISEASSSVSVDVSRLVSRVSITQITNSFELEQYHQSKFEIKRIYLVNVAGNKEYDGTSEATFWYNNGKLDEKAEALHLISTGNLENVELGHNAVYKTAHYFYCYPNSATDENAQSMRQSPTRLVVEMAIDGVVYYYPVTIPDIDSNHSYNVKLNIKRLGSAAPDIPVEFETAGFTVNVQDWVAGFDKDVTI